MSCPAGMKPSVDYLICQRYNHNSHGYNGYWTYPADFIHHKIVCLEDHEENPYYIGPNNKQKCKDLNEKYFDNTVDVSWYAMQSQLIPIIIKKILLVHLYSK